LPEHAFRYGRKGEVRTELSKIGGHLERLAVADNGMISPRDISLWNAKTLALRLVRILANNMDAAVEVRPRPGTEVKVVFPNAGRVTDDGA
jgi:two-component sensor histidine kinase